MSPKKPKARRREVPPTGRPAPQQDLHIKYAQIGGVTIVDSHATDSGRAGLHIGDGTPTEELPPLPHPVDIEITGHHPELVIDAEGHAGTMVTGGSVGRLDGRLRHRPGASGWSGYTPGIPGRTCECGFEAYAFSTVCSKCGKPLKQ